MQPKKRAIPITVSEEDIKNVLNQHPILQRQLAEVGAQTCSQNSADSFYQGDKVGSNNIVDQSPLRMTDSLGEGNEQGQEIEMQVGYINQNPQTGQTDMIESNGNNLNPTMGNDKMNPNQSVQNAKTNQEVIDNLTGKDIFKNENAVTHVLLGVVKNGKKAGGFHYEGMPQQIGKIIQGTELPPNQFGVYEANVEINGIRKNAKSTFFPTEWTAQNVIDAIYEVYNSRNYRSGNTYYGYTNQGIEIVMYLDPKNKIISAYPIY